MNAIERRWAGVSLTLLSVLASPGPTMAGGPTVAQLLDSCARGAAHGNKGVDAATCEWFAVPCGCKPGQVGSEIYRWCIPPAESTTTTMNKVVAELRRVPERSAAIDQVIPVILARLYPCQPGGDD
ncbi:hypothetical protein [uncultured Thiodictyon sp.]|uniref:hypothetical protein n=1 Tax=uncultured Thiodictyon sp. TaxID=1846217 RepID=UPI0025ED36FA|nr:hypothetical protein [uncultured Thiodictyon sp.]